MNEKSYLWSLHEGDELHGPYASVEAAEHAACEDLADDEMRNVDVFDARPATADDAWLFDSKHVDEEDGGCDISQPNWWANKWVPENIVHRFSYSPAKPAAS